MIGLLPPALAVCALLYASYHYYPPLGARQRAVRKARHKRSKNYSGRAFVNYLPTPMGMGTGGMRSMLRDQLRTAPLRKPTAALTPATPRFTAAPAGNARVTWLGHSAILVNMHHKNILLDPMFSKRASPFQWAGPKRFAGARVLGVADLPVIDAVVISHDHYDHLDYHSIKQLATRVKHFFVPLGVGAHLERWGVPVAHITELDWWESYILDDITFTCTPSRHFSGRTLTDRFHTLWASWVVDDGSTRLFFSGDTGYGPHFTQIGKKYGPFDLALLECGQYDHRWPNIHMQPEQTALAAADLRAKRMLPIHWGAFQLAFHDWTDSVERVLLATKDSNTSVATPQLGETFVVKGTTYPHDLWWRM
jgi:L-ascorbate metabolism protein UlaG (beta-lactamase superfamily)